MMPKPFIHIVRKPIVILLLIAVAGGVAGLHWFQTWSTAPSSTDIRLTSPVADTQKKTSYQTIGTSSRLFSTEIPAEWTVRINTSSPDLLQIVSFAKSGSAGQAAVTVATLPGGGLPAVDSYILRSKDTATYMPAATDGFKGATALFTSKTTPPAYTLYLLHGTRYASITITDMPSDPDARELLKHICDSWQWL